MFKKSHLYIFIYIPASSFDQVNECITLFLLQLPITQRSVSPRGKVQPESQTSNDSDKDLVPKTEPRRVKIFDGGYVPQQWRHFLLHYH